MVVLKNGMWIIGEIKKLDRGKLEYATDDIGRIYIEWDQINRITSKGRFHIELADGRAYFGSIEEASEDGKMVILGSTRYDAEIKTRIEVDLLSAVRITPMEAQFYERLKGFLDLGFGYQKANKLITVSIGADMTYHARKWEMNLSANSYFSKQTNAESARRHNFSLRGRRFMPKRWSGNVISRFEHNKELNLDLRASLAAGFGRNLIQNNRMVLLLGGGLSGNSEKYADSDSSTYNLEALGVLDFQAFRYNDPELDITATLRILPSLTDFGRVRIEFESRLQYEIFTDIYWGLGIFENYDSRPPGERAIKYDFGINTTINWKFK
jgi:hypothetical protein